MNEIKKVTVQQLGYGFIKDLPKGKDEYYLRNKQNRSGIDYRSLTSLEIFFSGDFPLDEEIRSISESLLLSF